MSKHTPGPWEAVFLFTADIPENAKVCIHAAPKSDLHNGTKVAEAEFSLGKSNYHVDSREEAEANARLIAAAPETAAERDRLKEINEELLDALVDVMFRHVPFSNKADYANRARAVVAKATRGYTVNRSDLIRGRWYIGEG